MQNKLVLPRTNIFTSLQAKLFAARKPKLFLPSDEIFFNTAQIKLQKKSLSVSVSGQMWEKQHLLSVVVTKAEFKDSFSAQLSQSFVKIIAHFVVVLVRLVSKTKHLLTS